MRIVYEMPTEIDLEILPFSTYDLIIDARTENEFEDDHIPGAVNLPALSEEEYSEVGDIVKSRCLKASARGVSAAMTRVGGHIGKMAGEPKAKSALVYCLRGGKRSLVWAGGLRAMDIDVKILPGGWKSYRRWVVANLDKVSRYFEYRVLAGHPGCGQEQLLAAIRQESGQVLDLGRLANRAGMPLSWLSAEKQPQQRLFESLVLEALRALSSDQPVWVVNWGDRVGTVRLPRVLNECLKDSMVFELQADISLRVASLMTKHGDRLGDMGKVLSKLLSARPDATGRQALEYCKSKAGNSNVADVLAALLTTFYDTRYRDYRVEMTKIEDARVVEMRGMDEALLRKTARMLMTDSQKRAMGRRGLRGNRSEDGNAS